MADLRGPRPAGGHAARSGEFASVVQKRVRLNDNQIPVPARLNRGGHITCDLWYEESFLSGGSPEVEEVTET